MHKPEAISWSFQGLQSCFFSLMVFHYLHLRHEFNGFSRCFSKKTLTSQIYHQIISVLRLELKTISPCFVVKFYITYTAFSAILICKTFRNMIDYIYRRTAFFWSYLGYLRGESLSDNIYLLWYKVLIIYVNILQLKALLKPFCKLLFSKLIHFPSDFDPDPTTQHQNLHAYSVIYSLNICQCKLSLKVFYSSVISSQTQSKNDSCRLSIV